MGASESKVTYFTDGPFLLSIKKDIQSKKAWE
jgi:hypothetical protein